MPAKTSRIAEVVYKLRDLFTRPADKIEDGYRDLRGASSRTADQVDRDTDRMGASLRRLGTAAKAGIAAFVGVFTGRQVVGAIGDVADELDRLGKTAARLDIDANTLAALEFSADRSGVAINKVAASLGTLQKRTGEAVQGFGAAVRAFDQLGIEVEEFQQLDAEQQLIELANGISAIADEEQRAAVAAGLFSKANSDLLNVLNEGGPALQRLIAEGKEFRQVTDQATAAAAAYNDALTNLSAGIDGQKFRLLTPLIEGVNRQLERFDLGADKVANLRTQTEAAADKLETLNQVARKGSRVIEVAQREYDELRERLGELEAAQQAEAQAAEAAAESRRKQIEQDEQYRETLEALTGQFEEKARAQESALSQETRALEAARREQGRIEAEFEQLVSNIAAPVDQDVGLIDVFTKIRQASAAAENEQSDLAVRLAREGGQFLEALKEKGTESALVLQFLAKQLQATAKQAAEQQTQVELIDQQKAEAALNDVKNKLGALESDAAKAGGDVGRAFVNALQIEIDKADIQLPQLSARLQERLSTLPTNIADTIRAFQQSAEKNGGK